MRKITFISCLFGWLLLALCMNAQNLLPDKFGSSPKLVLQSLEKLPNHQSSSRLNHQPEIQPGNKTIEFTKNKELSLKEGKWLSVNFSPTVQKSTQRKRSEKAIADLAGYYIQKDKSHYTPNDLAYSCISLTKNEDNTWKITNFWGLQIEITATIDMEAGTISIAPQAIMNNATYGPVYIYPIDLNNMTYSQTDPITGTIDKKGTISLNPWGAFVAEGQYKGRCYDAMDYTEFVLTNSVVTNVTPDGTVKYPALIEQNYDNELVVINFASNGKAINVALNPDKSVSVSPQFIFSNSAYGNFYCYPADWKAGSVPIEGPIKGTGTANSLKFGNWGIFSQIQNSVTAMKVGSTDITTSFTIRYPKSLTVSFEGSGTSGSPYLIKTTEHLQMFAQSVNSGTNYKGKYFKLVNNLDMSAMMARFRPIGNSNEHAFAGTFDGNTQIISNLSIDTGGDNYAGFFGILASSGMVKNLKLSQLNFESSGSYIGGIVGGCIGNLENCSVQGTINVANIIAGGIAGAVYGTVKGCSFDGTIAGYGDTGGVVGSNNGKVLNCWANASVTMSGFYSTRNRAIGGVVGSQVAGNRTDCQVSDCYFIGSVTDKYGYGYIGGVIGEALKGAVARCFNVGSVSSNTNTGEQQGSVGGILGFALEITMNDCYNAGTVVCSGNGTWVGGAVGYVLKGVDMGGGEPEPTLIKNVYNTGMVTSALLGGQKALYGETYSKDVFVNCYYDSQVSGLKGGIGEMLTTELTAEEGPSGFNTSVWNISKGQYPRIKGIDEVSVAHLSAAVMTLNGDETIKKVKTNFKVSTENNIVWKLLVNGSFVTSDDGLSINGGDVTLKNIYSTELLCAFTPDEKNIKFYSLALVAKKFEGDGTEQSPYLIKSKEDLIALNKATTVHQQPHEGDYFKMTNDINLEYDKNFSGIAADGNDAHCFGGIFDGDGYSIHKLKILSTGFDDKGVASTTGAYLYPGFFGLCTQTSVIKNLTIANDCDFTFWGYGGPVAGYTEGRIENCLNYAPVNAVVGYIGGIAGVTGATAVIKNCYNSGSILAGDLNAGGIVGQNLGTVNLSQNDGRVTADFFNAYKKKGTQSLAGGIAGSNYGTIDNCSNNGYVTSYKSVGGIAGGNSSNSGAGNIKNSVNTALIECLSDETTRGGIIGYLASKTTIENNYYDVQLNTFGGSNNAKISGAMGLTTKELVKGAKLANLPEGEWSFVTNAYPVLTKFANEEAAIAARNTFVSFADEESRSVIKTEATLSNRSTLTWTLKQSKNFRIDGRKLSVTIPTDETVAYDTLVAVYDKYQKVYPVAAIPDILKGYGSEKSPFLIETTDDMTKLANFIEKSKMEYSGNRFLLINDLDYTDKEYKPIAAAGSTRFQGYFDGNGKKISNVIYEKTASSNKNNGLFGTVGESGTIANLTLESGSIKLYTYAAGIAGNLYGTIDNCINKATIHTSNSGYAGGIAATAYDGALIKNSTNYGKIMSKTNYTGGIVSTLKAGAVIDGCKNEGEILPTTDYGAGIAALSNGKIMNSYNTGKISGKTYMAGIVASHAEGDTIINCYNSAEISASAGTVGGIIAMTANKIKGLIDNCYNTGAISGKGTVGGIAGKVQSGTSIHNSYNTGEINSSGANTGGLLGSLAGSDGFETNLINCYNKGNVTSTSGNYVGGVVGTISQSAIIENCYNSGNVSGAANFNGGFSGGCSAVTKNCWNAGNVTAEGYGIGGFSGIGSGTALNCFNVGDVTCTGGAGESTRFSNVGGLWGYGSCDLTNCYNMGTLTAADRIGGINGVVLTGTFKMTNCYNGGKIIATAETPVKVGNVIMPYDEGIEVLTENIYFDKTINTNTYPVDSVGVGLTSKEMFATSLGDGYIYAEATYPVLTDFSKNAIPNFYASTILLSDNDTSGDVKEEFKIGTPEGVTWTTTEHFVIDGSKVTPVKVGEGVLTVTAGELTKTYPLNVTYVSSIDEIGTGTKTCISRTYYTVGGMMVSQPGTGLYIVKCLYEDGTEETHKVIIK